MPAEIVRRNADNVGQTLARAIKICQHRQCGAGDTVEEDRLVPAPHRRLSHGRQLVLWVDRTVNVEDFAALAQGLHVVAHLHLSPPGLSHNGASPAHTARPAMLMQPYGSRRCSAVHFAVASNIPTLI